MTNKWNGSLLVFALIKLTCKFIILVENWFKFFKFPVRGTVIYKMTKKSKTYLLFFYFSKPFRHELGTTRWFNVPVMERVYLINAQLYNF